MQHPVIAPPHRLLSPRHSTSRQQQALCTAVNLLHHVPLRPVVPLVACIPHRLRDTHMIHSLRLHHEGRKEPTRGVPGDVAMETPDTYHRKANIVSPVRPMRT